MDKGKLKDLAHDLNNLLATISNNAALLNRKAKLEENGKELLESIQQCALRAADILDGAVNNNEIKRVPRRINLALLINEIVSAVNPSLNGRILLNVNKQKRIPFVNGIYTELYRAFYNIIINAIEAIEDSGKIDVTIGVERTTNNGAKRRLLIQVKDNGEGITEENQTKIFNEHFSTKSKKQESGLGLGIVREVIESHGGQIDVASKVNVGTEFKIYLPAAEENTALMQHGKKILLADDDTSIREVLAELLESYDYKVLQAENGTKLLTEYNAHPDLDLLIVDNRMPDIDGVDCIKQIRLFNGEVPIVLSTGSRSEMKDSEVNALGLNAVLNKPYDFNNLLDTVDGLLSRS